MSLFLFVCFVVRDKIIKQNRLQRITLGKKVLKIGQKIEWGRERHKQFWSFWGYNFVSFKGMTQNFGIGVLLVKNHVTL